MALGLLWVGLLMISCAGNGNSEKQGFNFERSSQIENPFLDPNGFVPVAKMTHAQLLMEKSSIEKKLAESEDSTLLKYLNSKDAENFDLEFDSLSSQSNIYQANGKLIRFSKTEMAKRKIATYMKESENNFRFLRYHQIRLQIAKGEFYVAATKVVREKKPSEINFELNPTINPTINPKTNLSSDGNVDTLSWIASYKMNDSIWTQNMEKFQDAESCKNWGEKIAKTYSQIQYAGHVCY